MAIRTEGRKGQALVMVTLALFAMVGLIGLSVDFGWAFFVQRAAQSAADAAALAAIKNVMDSAVSAADYQCTGSVVQCYATPTQCPIPPATLPRNLSAACLYASMNGFSRANTRQNITVQASDRVTAPTVSGCAPVVAHPPTAPCVDTEYWVTVRVSETVPQLFSAIFGNANALVSARATAAVAQSEVIGSLILLNREADVSPEVGVSRNLVLGGGPTVTVPGGIVLSSSGNTTGYEAGFINGSGIVSSPFTYIRDTGTYDIRGSGVWSATPTNESTPSLFLDPMRGKGQPPLNASQSSLPVIQVPDGVLSTAVCPAGICPAGNYVATETDRTSGITYATGARITVPNDSTFNFSGTTFGDYVFFGGLYMDRANVTFGPGRYVMAGTLSDRDAVFETTTNTMVRGGTSETSDAGRLFILTDYTYGGRLNATTAGITLPHKNGWSWSDLKFNDALLKSGNTASSSVKLYGLNPASTDLPADLKTFGPILAWQDQANSYVKYTASGEIDVSCPGATITNPCPSTTLDTADRPDSPKLDLWASQEAVWGGIIYQPRGAWTWVQAVTDYSGPLRIITGAMQIQGTARLTLTSPTVPLTRLVAALVE